MREFGQGVAALYTDLGDRMSDVVILTMSEFGRTARQNGNNGTDHGHATCFFALGGDVNGGKVLGKWPGLAPEQLYENRDLALTTDFRAVFGEIAIKHLGAQGLQRIFPGYRARPPTSAASCAPRSDKLFKKADSNSAASMRYCAVAVCHVTDYSTPTGA